MIKINDLTEEKKHLHTDKKKLEEEEKKKQQSKHDQNDNSSDSSSDQSQDDTNQQSKTVVKDEKLQSTRLSLKDNYDENIQQMLPPPKDPKEVSSFGCAI